MNFKKIAAILVLLSLVIIAASCAEKEVSPFTEKDGLYTFTDTENCPFDDCGLKIDVKNGDGGYIKFTKTGLDGAETVDYYTFFADGTMEKFYFVSAMGTGFYYTFDTSADELVKIENSEREDSSESTKSMGRWDSAQDTVRGEVASLREYFSANYGSSIDDALKNDNFGK
jgi:hypothetical protein